jgi:hypothetical protein
LDVDPLSTASMFPFVLSCASVCFRVLPCASTSLDDNLAAQAIGPCDSGHHRSGRNRHILWFLALRVTLGAA